VADGVAAVAWVGALAALLLVLGAASGWKQGLVAWALCALGLGAGVALPGRELLPGLVLVGAALAVAMTGRTHAGLGVLVGLALTARVGGGPWSGSMGLAAGALGAGVVVGPAAVAVGRLLQRRPRAWRVVRWVAAAIVCFAVGFRVAA
jgi:hypothetical protein